MAGEEGRGGPDTRELRDTLANTGLSSSCSFMSYGSSTGPRLKLCMTMLEEEDMT